MRKPNKLFSLLLCLTMAVPLMTGSLTVFAEEESSEEGDIVFTIYTQEGENGTREKAAEFTLEDLYAKAETYSDGYTYLYTQNEAWRAVVATTLVPLETLLTEADATSYWKEGSYLAFTCEDGPYEKSYPYYENINVCCYDYSGDTQIIVPAGLALVWDAGALADKTVAEIAAGAYDSGSLRFVYGISQEQYTDINPAGARMPVKLIEMTVVYDAAVPDGSVGTVHTDTGDTQTGTPDVQQALPFTDIAQSDWCYEAVQYVYTSGLMNGVDDVTFVPNSSTTRSMLLTVLYRYEGEPAVTASPKFSDVVSGAWYTDAVVWATENGIVAGYGDGTFGINDAVTREQMVTILYRYAQYKGADVSASDSLAAYSDAGTIGNWALSAMQWAVGTGLITGTDNTSISPAGNATRAQVATVLQRYIEQIAE